MSTSPDSVTYPVQAYGLFTGLPVYTSTGQQIILLLQNLPTSDSGLPSGAAWNNGGVLCVAT